MHISFITLLPLILTSIANAAPIPTPVANSPMPAHVRVHNERGHTVDLAPGHLVERGPIGSHSSGVVADFIKRDKYFRPRPFHSRDEEVEDAEAEALTKRKYFRPRPFHSRDGGKLGDVDAEDLTKRNKYFRPRPFHSRDEEVSDSDSPCRCRRDEETSHRDDDDTDPTLACSCP